VGVALGLATVRPESRAAVSGGKWFRTAMPIGFFKACSMASGNAAYLYLGLGFIQMLQTFTPAVVLAVMWALGLDREPRPAKWFVYVMVAGTMVEVRGELHATALGLVLMIVAQVLDAVSNVMTQILLQDFNFTVIEGLYYIAPPSTFFLVGLAACLEWPTMLRNNDQQVVAQHPMYFVVVCLLGLSVNFVGMMLMQVTSSLYCKILVTVRSVGMVLFGVRFYGEECGLTEALGYAVVLLGFTGYNCVKMFPSSASTLEQRVDACFYEQKGSPR
jgi:drug/metabolite transporter (DMT)-like permease